MTSHQLLKRNFVKRQVLLYSNCNPHKQNAIWHHTLAKQPPPPTPIPSRKTQLHYFIAAASFSPKITLKQDAAEVHTYIITYFPTPRTYKASASGSSVANIANTRSTSASISLSLSDRAALAAPCYATHPANLLYVMRMLPDNSSYRSRVCRTAVRGALPAVRIWDAMWRSSCG